MRNASLGLATAVTPDHRPRKRFGQNFLHDPGSIRRILAAIDPRPGERIVEIGPGQGAITAGLLEAAGALDVVEIDRDLVGPLAERLGGRGSLRVHLGDALRFDLCALAGDDGQPAGPRLRLVGNLPYNLSTPLLFRFLEQADCLIDLHLLLQKEVVLRITAEPGGKTYGRLSVMVQTWCAASRLCVIGPGAFHPAPKVDSALVRLVPHRPLPDPVQEPALHARLVAAAFAQRRKTLRNSLGGLATPGQLESLGLDPGARAETIAVADWVRLANALAAGR